MDELAPFLTQAIIINILKRLPVKSLKRFQCVSKQWNTLIKTPSFIQHHLHHSTHQNPCLLFQPKRDDQYISHLYSLNTHMQVLQLPTIPPFEASQFTVRGSSNGILCVEIHMEGIYPPPVVLFNPATRDVLELPFYIDDFEGECYVGFGYSSVVNDYRIVRSYARIGRSIGDVEVYSVSSGSWKIEDLKYMPPMLFHADAVTINGFMYWSAETFEIDGEDEVIGTSRAVVSYDIASNLFDYVAIPALGEDSVYQLLVYQDKVVLVSHLRDADPSMLELWMMEGHVGGSPFVDSRGWTKVFSTHCSAVNFVVASIFWRDELVYNVLEFSELVDDETKYEAETGLSTAFYLLNISTGRKNIGAARRCGDWRARIFIYVESLVPVGKITPMLPYEIIRNILVRLPVKSLKRFQCVCKYWKYLIKTQSFIQNHLHRSTHQNPCLLFQPKRDGQYISHLYSLNTNMQLLQLPTIPKLSRLPSKVVGSSNGLLCIEYHVKGLYPHPLVLFNPATMDALLIPPSRYFGKKFKGECYLGFGYSPIVDDCMIVRTYAVCGDTIFYVEVYSLRTRSWEEDDLCNVMPVRFNSDAVTANGSMFWISSIFDMPDDDDDEYEDELKIVSFDIVSRQFNSVLMPEVGNESIINLMVYEDKLAVFEHALDAKLDSMFVVWVMEEDEEEDVYMRNRRWSKIFSSYCSAVGFLVPAIFWKGDFVYNVVEIPMLGGEAEDDIITVFFKLNVSTNERKIFTSRRCGNGNARCFNYAESLVPVSKRLIERDFDKENSRIYEIPVKDRAGSSSSISYKAKFQLNQVKLPGTRRPYVTYSQRGRDGWVIVNVNGVYSHTTGKAGCGGIIKDHSGNLLEAFMLNIQDVDLLTTNFWACLMGLRRAWDGNHKKVCLRNDSAEAIKLIKNGNNVLHENWNLILENRHMLKRDWLIDFEHIHRENNMEAYILAKRSLEMSPGFHLVPLSDFRLFTSCNIV